MNRTHLRWGIFAFTLVIQFGLILGIIWKHEHILAAGTPVKFRMVPRDPYDPFRGRYMQLSFAISQTVPVAEKEKLERNQTAYAILELDNEGYASVKELTQYKPWKGQFLKVKVTGADNQTAYFAIPFDRYYMNETAAPEAERILSERLRSRATATSDAAPSQDYAIVRLLQGAAVIEDLIIDGQPIESLMR